MRNRIQLRSRCCACGREVAVDKQGNTSHHGYQVAWGQFNDACYGSKKVHEGHKNAPVVMQKIVKDMEEFLAKIPNLIAKNQANIDEIADDHHIGISEGRRLISKHRRTINELENVERALPYQIEQMQERIKNHKEYAPWEVDLEVEEAEERKKREAERAAKLAEKAKEEEAKKARIKAREEKAIEKAKYMDGPDVFKRIVIRDEDENVIVDHEYQRQSISTRRSADYSSDMRVECGRLYAQYEEQLSGHVHITLTVRSKANGKGRKLDETKCWIPKCTAMAIAEEVKQSGL